MDMKTKRLIGEKRLLATPFLWGMAVVAAILIGVANPTFAQEFRVDNRVFLEDNEEPEIETTTFFHGSFVYDCISDDGEITIYDTGRERIVLLDSLREVCTETTYEELHGFIQDHQRLINQQEDSYLRFMANPQFQTTYDEETSLLVLNSPLVTYRIRTQPTDEEKAAAYRQFTDWTSRLSTRMHVGSSPPFARMKVNEQLDSRGLLPKEIYLTLRSGENSITSSPFMLRSEHDYRMGLTESELRQIAAIGRRMASFEKISMDEYVCSREEE